MSALPSKMHILVKREWYYEIKNNNIEKNILKYTVVVLTKLIKRYCQNN